VATADQDGAAVTVGQDGAAATVHDEVLNCRGSAAPLPVIKLAQRLPELPVGAVLRVLADVPAAANDVPAWCRLQRQEFAGSPAPHTHDVRRMR